MTREEQILNGFTEVMRGVWNNQELEVSNPGTPYKQEPCEDEYIKIPKKALKYRTAGMVAYNTEWLKDHFDIERAVICGAQKPCEDAISRQAAIDAFEKFIHELGIEDEPYNYGEMALSAKNVPSVNPQPKVGHWILKEVRQEKKA